MTCPYMNEYNIHSITVRDGIVYICFNDDKGHYIELKKLRLSLHVFMLEYGRVLKEYSQYFKLRKLAKYLCKNMSKDDFISCMNTLNLDHVIQVFHTMNRTSKINRKILHILEHDLCVLEYDKEKKELRYVR